jgi:hypothetical protein
METNEMDRTEVSKYFSDISRNAGKVVFRITYTATPGNIEIDKQFQEFCFKHANNEYLVGLQLLLKAFKHYDDVVSLSAMIDGLAVRVESLEKKGDKDGLQTATKEEVKTF